MSHSTPSSPATPHVTGESPERTEVRSLLDALARELQTEQLWDAQPPSEQALASTVPFMFDTLRIEQWLQWVFMPRVHALLDAGAPLPGNCSIHPLAEHQWSTRDKQALPKKALSLLEQIDARMSQLGAQA